MIDLHLDVALPGGRLRRGCGARPSSASRVSSSLGVPRAAGRNASAARAFISPTAFEQARGAFRSGRGRRGPDRLRGGRPLVLSRPTCGHRRSVSWRGPCVRYLGVARAARARARASRDTVSLEVRFLKYTVPVLEGSRGEAHRIAARRATLRAARWRAGRPAPGSPWHHWAAFHARPGPAWLRSADRSGSRS